VSSDPVPGLLRHQAGLHSFTESLRVQLKIPSEVLKLAPKRKKKKEEGGEGRRKK